MKGVIVVAFFFLLSFGGELKYLYAQENVPIKSTTKHCEKDLKRNIGRTYEIKVEQRVSGGKKGPIETKVIPRGWDVDRNCAGECVAYYEKPQIAGTFTATECFDDAQGDRSPQDIEKELQHAELYRQVYGEVFGLKPVHPQMMSLEYAKQVLTFLDEEKREYVSSPTQQELQARALRQSQAALELQRLAEADLGDESARASSRLAMQKALQLADFANEPLETISTLGSSIRELHPSLQQAPTRVSPITVGDPIPRQTFPPSGTDDDVAPETSTWKLLEEFTEPDFWRGLWYGFPPPRTTSWADQLDTSASAQERWAQRVRDWDASGVFGDVRAQQTVKEIIAAPIDWLAALDRGAAQFLRSSRK